MEKFRSSISTPAGAARLSLGVVISLIVLKVIVSLISHSISITAQATDSLLDLFSIGITYVAVRMAVAPADEQHPFGHGKIEVMSALVQAVLVLGAGSYIIYSAVKRLIDSTPIEPDEGIVVMVVSIIASFLLSRHLLKVARTSGSMAIEASAKNIRADVFSASGVLVALILVRFTGLVILDPVIALVMSVFVLKAGFEVARSAFRELTDSALPREEQALIIKSLDEHNTRLVEFHALRTRRAGKQRFIEMHLVLPRNVSVDESHQMCDHLENDIKEKLAEVSISIHVEPCSGQECRRCRIRVCSLRQG